ncbi:hypothetical protein HTT03_12975 [Sulfitobacter sp. S0837]|uniref:hypothetical protein n=1 Tax=Sulfitobacter maritimus TaxID=2741719 RepID=UPI0015816E3F|nr:hypothetical protein [Sulfitobacter maritimus]NUH66200.1 hypothetical protein [Sulfitobacter maritimus]
MSAPDTDTETQKKRHRHAIRGIKTAIIVGALLMIAAIVYYVLQATDPSPETAAEAEVRAGQKDNAATSTAPPDLQQ